MWNDYRIRWNVTEYGGLTEIVVVVEIVDTRALVD